VSLAELLAFAGRHPILSTLFAVLTVAVVASELKRLLGGGRSLPAAELIRLINQDQAVVIDISPKADFEKGHIAGSQHVAASEIGPQHKLLAGKQDANIVLVCRSGMTAAGAAERLRKAGFGKATTLDGGIAAWRSANLPLVRGRQ
jgi:rhodanese-related sulfurtransferase